VTAPHRARLLVSGAAAAAIATDVLLALLTAVLVGGRGGSPAAAYGSAAFGAAGLAVGLLVLARAGAVARTDAARGRALCIRCCVGALFAVLPVFIVGGVASYLTRRCDHMGEHGGRRPALRPGRSGGPAACPAAGPSRPVSCPAGSPNTTDVPRAVPRHVSPIPQPWMTAGAVVLRCGPRAQLALKVGARRGMSFLLRSPRSRQQRYSSAQRYRADAQGSRKIRRAP